MMPYSVCSTECSEWSMRCTCGEAGQEGSIYGRCVCGVVGRLGADTLHSMADLVCEHRYNM